MNSLSTILSNASTDGAGASGGANFMFIVVYIIIFGAIIYFMMIRPQKKKDKEIKEMRNSLTVGDEIVTIGGICGKIVKTKDDSFIIQVGADKVKFEMMRWAVSSVTKESSRRENVEEAVEEEPKKVVPKRLKKSSEIEETTEEKENKAE